MTPLAALVDEPVPEAAARQQLGEDGTAGARSRRTRERWAASGLVVAVAVAAFAVRMWIAVRGGGIGGTYGYDDGVYYAASASFVWGRLPYRDFVLLHPPGVMLALTPFALLGRITRDHVGFETARVAWMLVGALNASLVFRICRRGGLVAATAGGLFYAVWTPAALTETNTRLEPLVTLGLLVAVTLLSRRPGPPSRRVLLWAGAALALSVSVKIWAVVPGALVLLWVWRRAGTKAAGWTVLGGLTAGMLVDGPFLLAAPTQMFRMVVRDQLARGRTPMDTAARLAHVLVPGIAPPYQWSPGPATLVMGGCVLAVVGLACLGSGSGRFAVSLLGVQVLVLVLSPSFFSYYNAFAVPGLALVVAQVVRWTLALSGAGPTFRAWGGSNPRVTDGRGARHGTRAGPVGEPGCGLSRGDQCSVPRGRPRASRRGCSVRDLRLPRRSAPDRPVHARPPARLPGAGRPQRSDLRPGRRPPPARRHPRSAQPERAVAARSRLLPVLGPVDLRPPSSRRRRLRERRTTPAVVAGAGRGQRVRPAPQRLVAGGRRPRSRLRPDHASRVEPVDVGAEPPQRARQQGYPDRVPVAGVLQDHGVHGRRGPGDVQEPRAGRVGERSACDVSTHSDTGGGRRGATCRRS